MHVMTFEASLGLRSRGGGGSKRVRYPGGSGRQGGRRHACDDLPCNQVHAQRTHLTTNSSRVAMANATMMTPMILGAMLQGDVRYASVSDGMK